MNKNKYLTPLLICVINIFALLFIITSVSAEDPKWTLPNPKITFSDKLKFGDPAKCDTFKSGDKTLDVYCVPWMAEYIKVVYNWGINIVGIVAAVAMVIGGAIWITAGGNASKVGEARSWIGSALTGLVLALGSYTIMFWVNPDLIKFNPLRVIIPAKEEIQKISTASTEDRKFGCGFRDESECSLEYGNVYGSPEDCSAGTDTSGSTNPIPTGQVCCCNVKPVDGCSWQSLCTDQQNDSDYSYCGTNYGGEVVRCCCNKSSIPPGTACNNGECTQVDNAINQLSQANNINPSLVKSIIVGGEGCSNAPGTSGECGYSQVIPATRQSYCQGLDCNDLMQDIQCGINVLNAYSKIKNCQPGSATAPANCTSAVCILAACYNAGPGHASGVCGTNNYCQRVDDYYDKCNQ